ncbi:MAG: Snf7 family protein [Sulfolobales archaeon]|jgi:division protein CdvB (Snf7/Vps24/ESCRT-III family)|nr:Snf7 family protein [Desulfurococcaceae archaeon]
MVYEFMSVLKGFEKVWQGKQDTISDKIKRSLGREKPLRYRMAMASYKIRSMVSRIEVFIERMKERDRILFERVVDALMVKDTARATMYANEVAELRKVVKQLLTVQIALEQITLRLETVQEIGDVMVALGPVLGIVKELRSTLRGLLPEIGIELAEVEDMLRDTVLEAGEVLGGGGYDVIASPEARKILQEAQVIAEQKMKEKFPELPSIPTAPSEAKSAEAQH